jgi:hypothetical protein
MAVKDTINKAKQIIEEQSHKAILEIKDAEYFNTSRFSKEEGANTILAKAADKLNNTATEILSTPLAIAKSAVGLEARGIDEGVIQVQYNPSSIKYSGNASYDSAPPKTETTGDSSHVVSTVTSANAINMSFTLVFHSKYTTDQSVKKQMELIMNMIYDSPTKEITFSWGNMQANGKLVSFSGKYDMFDMTGNPTSGRMDMTMRLNIDDKETEKMIEDGQKDRKDNAAED